MAKNLKMFESLDPLRACCSTRQHDMLILAQSVGAKLEWKDWENFRLVDPTMLIGTGRIIRDTISCPYPILRTVHGTKQV